ncbi:fimbrial protein [Winslowiella toletana]|uniref:fimbrial protein n=1 Tax=Winslowiella toletana TaxID=92490 RepID=UPI0028BD3001|nr:fimbrial protein [Winslowiella toletana]WNN43489.1 fimbrial protein [Winslowiella toletana]
MIKNFLSAILIALNFLPVHSYADQVKINITAKVMVRTCTISSGSKDFLVSLMPGDLRNAAVGVPFSATSFAINLEDCPANIKMAHVNFTAESDPVMPNLLKTTSDTDSDASGIAIGLYDSDNKNIDIRNNLTDFVINHDVTVNSLSFSAAYLKTNDNALPGKVRSFAYFEIAYD